MGIGKVECAVCSWRAGKWNARYTWDVVGTTQLETIHIGANTRFSYNDEISFGATSTAIQRSDSTQPVRQKFANKVYPHQGGSARVQDAHR
ncbi:hypothetical protein SAMN05428962_4418 [Paenibacillus sp. BC26]|nr:hypothetical protein SAMN05428962_4418 [Paenibacillus sp. BC26]